MGLLPPSINKRAQNLKYRRSMLVMKEALNCVGNILININYIARINQHKYSISFPKRI